SMLERVDDRHLFCNTCSHDWIIEAPEPVAPTRQRRGGERFASVDDLVARTGLRRDELVTLADIGALNALGYDRRSALWQVERAVRPSGELFEDHTDVSAISAHHRHSACGLASEASGPARGGARLRQGYGGAA